MLQSLTLPSIGAFSTSALLHLLVVWALVLPVGKDATFLLPKGQVTEVTLISNSPISDSRAFSEPASVTKAALSPTQLKSDASNEASPKFLKDEVSKAPVKPRAAEASAAAASEATTQPVGPDSTESGVPGGSEEAVRSALSDYLIGLRQRIEGAKVYPALSRRLGERGKVILSFVVRADGRITDLKVKRSSSHSRLDQAAMETVKSIRQHQPFPSELSQERLVVDLPIQFVF